MVYQGAEYAGANLLKHLCFHQQTTDFTMACHVFNSVVKPWPQVVLFTGFIYLQYFTGPADAALIKGAGGLQKQFLKQEHNASIYKHIKIYEW